MAPPQTVLQLFAVPIAVIEDAIDASTNAAVAKWILEEQGRDAGIECSIVGGWHSRPDLPNRGVAALDTLFGAVVEQVRGFQSKLSRGPPQQMRFMLQAWATVLRRGHYVQLHDHADSHWSIVHYVDAGDSDAAASGRISWLNPMGAHREVPGIELAPTTFTFTPRSGLLVVFPGWLRHSVEPYQGERPRIAVAANIEVQRVRS